MIHHQWQQYLRTSSTGAGRGTTGIAYVPELAAVRFAGTNAHDFLQGYLTCDTAQLRQDTLLPAALCNLKGRVVMNGWCVAEDDDVLLILHESLVERLAQFLTPYLKFSRHTSLVDLRADVLVLAGLDLAEGSGGLAIDARRRLFPVSGLAEARTLWEQHPQTTADVWLAALTADGIPLVSAPVSETFLPQMLDLQKHGAIDFEKGCYLGQEIVARAQHRGQVKRQLCRMRWQGSAPPVPGAEVTGDDGRGYGVVLQHAVDSPGSGPALAVLRETTPPGLRQGDTRLDRLM